MKIAYISIQDSTNIRSFSGTGYYIPKALQQNGAEVNYIGNLKIKPFLPEKAKTLYYKYLHKKIYWYNRNPKVINNFCRQAEKELKNTDYDVVLSFSGPSIALIKTDKPMVIWSDAVFADIIDFYPEFTSMADITIKNGHKMEKALLDRCAHLVYSSDWAAKGAMRYYDIPPEKISVIPYGANIETNRKESDVEEIIRKKDKETCRLLFAGVHWERKGGDQALEVAKELNSRGYPTELHILGSQPGKNNTLPSYVKVHGFISKETEEGKKRINNLIKSAHFLILPTRADCTPIVFAEFNSYGIPCLATNVGGISTIIKDDKNGKTFEPEASPSEYADYIQYLFQNYSSYINLAKSSFSEYKNRLNWDTAGAKMMDLLNNVVKAHKNSRTKINF